MVNIMNWLSEFGMSEWLIVCAAVLFIVVLVDGFRRMRAERQQDLKWDLQLAKDFPEDEEPSAEIVESDYRVVNRDGSNQLIEKDSSNSGFNALDEASVTESKDQFNALDAKLTSSDDLFDSEKPLDAYSENGNEITSAYNSPDLKIISLHVKSASAEGFLGSDLLQVLLACNMRYGETNILHRYADSHRNSGAVDFSVANMLEPGVFDLENLSGFRTPGITLFMAVPGPKNPLSVFNMMLETANCVAQTLNGVLLDDERSNATQQGINHYRDRIRQISVASEHSAKRAEKPFAVLED